MQTDSLFSNDDQLSLSLHNWHFLTNIRTGYEQYCVQRFIESHKTVSLIPSKQPCHSRIKLQRLIDLNYKYTFIIDSFIKHVLQFNIFELSSADHYNYIKDNY